MVDRLFLNSDALIVSKPGFDASNPLLSEGDKLFDSNWLFSSTIVEAGIHYDQANYQFPKRASPNQKPIAANESTDWSGPQYIDFTPLPFVPTVTLITLADPRYWADHGMVLQGIDPVQFYKFPNDYWRTGEITVTNSRITIPRCYSKAGKRYYRESFIYLIMGM